MNARECENEAKMLYEMYKKMGSLRDGTWEVTTCCADGLATMVISGKSLTLTYANGNVVNYIDMNTIA